MSRYLVAIALLPAFWATTAFAADAVVIGVYANCQPVSSTVMIKPGTVPEPDAQTAVAKAEALTAAAGFDQALPQVVKILERYGVKETEIRRQGYGGCEPPTSGKYVEALGSYCGAQLVSAEVRVDGKLFLRQANPDQSLEDFVSAATRQLRRKGIWDRPRVSVSNAEGCEPEPDAQPASRNSA